MKWIEKLERKYHHLGIPNLTVYLIACYIIGYALQMFAPGVMPYLRLDMARIFRGEIWRLVTWVLYPPNSSNLIFFAIAIVFFYYPIGTSLERTWGSFRYTLYIFSGLFFMILSALLLYLFTGNIVTTGGYVFPLPTSIFTTYYISLSIFLAFALSYPDMKILLWFVIPIKMSWMAIVYGLIVAYDIITYIRIGAWYMAVPIVASLLNFLIFYLSTKNLSRYNPKEVHRRREFQKAMHPGRGSTNSEGKKVSKHKCAVCGRTELDDPNLEFRFCSRCSGNYEYCQDHLFTHEHIK